MPCFNISWVGNDHFLFPYFLGNCLNLIFFNLFINVFIIGIYTYIIHINVFSI